MFLNAKTAIAFSEYSWKYKDESLKRIIQIANSLICFCNWHFYR